MTTVMTTVPLVENLNSASITDLQFVPLESQVVDSQLTMPIDIGTSFSTPATVDTSTIMSAVKDLPLQVTPELIPLNSNNSTTVLHDWVHPRTTLRSLRSDDLAIFIDSRNMWWIGKVMKVDDDADKVLVWEYGSSKWANPPLGQGPPRKLIWRPRYSNQKQDLFSNHLLSTSDEQQGFVKIMSWQHVDSAILWGVKSSVLQSGVVTQLYWDFINDILRFVYVVVVV